MKEKIILALDIFQDDHQVSMAFYCNVQGIKEGYMFLFLGNSIPERAIWQGLFIVLSRLVKQYRDRVLHMAFSPVYMQLGGGGIKEQTISLLNSFHHAEHIPFLEFRDNLQKVNLIGFGDHYQLNELKGYSLTEFEEKVTTQNQSKKKKFEVNPTYFSGTFMPSEGVCLDLETTSHLIQFARVIEIGALKFSKGQIVDTFQTFVNPKMKIPKSVRELTGISQRDVDRSPYSYDAIKMLVHYLNDCKYLVGHNILYDYSILDMLCQRYNLPRLDVELVCTKRLAKEAKVIVKDYRLETLLNVYGIINERPHRALPDATATFHLMNYIYDESFLIS